MNGPPTAAADLGLDGDRVAELIERAAADVRKGLLPACQLAVARHGRVAATATLGDTQGRHRFMVMSCTKALVAGAVWLLIGDGRLRPDQPVADVVPEFGTNGKSDVLVEHLLTHTAGFARAPLGPPEWHDRDARLAAFARWRVTDQPGSRVEYHATSAHWVLAEIITRLSGLDHRDFVNQRVLDPLGLHDLRLGVPVEGQGDIVELVAVNDAGADDPEAAATLAALDLGGVGPEWILRFNDPANRATGVPGAGAAGTASDLALYYQALLHNPGRLWDPAVLADGTGRVRAAQPDAYTGLPANRSLGLVIAGDDGFAFTRASMGKAVSPRAFGHDGVGGQIAWADPDTGISFAFLTNGVDRNLIRGHRRGVSLSSRAASLLA